jgi:hypothetical protein
VVFDDSEHYHALAQASAYYECGCFGVCESEVNYFYSYGCRLAGLPGPAGYYSLAPALQQFNLILEKGQVQDYFREKYRVASEFIFDP